MVAVVNFDFALLDFIKQARCLQQFLAETFGMLA